MEVGVLLTTTALIACTLGLIWLRAFKQRHKSKDAAELAVRTFVQELNLLRKKHNLLHEHVNEYFNTLHGAGWSDLQNLMVQLSEAERRVNECLRAGRYADTLGQANLLLNRVPPGRLIGLERRFPRQAALREWKKMTDERIARIAEDLEAAAIETKDMGVMRRRKRQATLIAISEVRRLRNEEEHRGALE